jgi:hypothetical protein
MRIQFNCELEDFVDTQLRFMKRSGALRAHFWRGLLSTALFCGFGASTVTAFAFGHWSTDGKMMVAFVGLALGAGLHLLTYQGELKKHIAKAWHGTSDGGGHLTCHVELTDSGICLRHRNTQSTYEWAEVEEVRESAGSIDIFTRGEGCGMAIHKRVFNSPEEQDKFVEIIERNSLARVTRL